jgi:hypothetical protein
MILLAWTSHLFASGDRSRRARSARSRAVARLADILFHKRVGVRGTLGRLALLLIGAVVSYFVGSGLGELMMKAPIPMALMFAAALCALASGDPDQR